MGLKELADSNVDLNRFGLWNDNELVQLAFWGVSSSSPLDLLLFAQIAFSSSCQDPRDKVYGIQSLLDLGVRIEVDYAKPAAEVYWLFVESWFRAYGEHDDFWYAFDELIACGLYYAAAMGLCHWLTAHDVKRVKTWITRKYKGHLRPQRVVDGHTVSTWVSAKQFLANCISGSTRREALEQSIEDSFGALKKTRNEVGASSDHSCIEMIFAIQ